MNQEIIFRIWKKIIYVYFMPEMRLITEDWTEIVDVNFENFQN